MDYYTEKEQLIPLELLRKLEKFIVLRTIDEKWRNHLLAMDQLREGIGLRAFGQKNPLIEYKSEAYTFFQELMINLQSSVIQRIFHAQIQDPSSQQRVSPLEKNIQLSHPDVESVPPPVDEPSKKQEIVNAPKVNLEEKIGRNQKIKVQNSKGDEIEIKFKKLASYLEKGYQRVE
jgi:preprotein translocase subunit SecA